MGSYSQVAVLPKQIDKVRFVRQILNEIFMNTTKLILILSAFSLPTLAHAQTELKLVTGRMRLVIYATAPDDDPNRLFVVEQPGNIRVLDRMTNEVLEQPYLVVNNLSEGTEKGLLGLAFHPDFASNGKLYTYSSEIGGSQDHQSQIFEYTVEDPMNNNVIDTSTRRSVLRFDQPYAGHNGGWIGFDPTATGDARNYLHIASGDGGNRFDPDNNAQDLTDNLLGKILRVDVAGDDFPTDEFQNYSIPATNPFVGKAGDGEILAYGLRNPWRASFDRQTGDLWIGDVGQHDIEEINILSAGTSGQNYGWRMMEGNTCVNPGEVSEGNLPCFDPSLTPPVYDYEHNQGAFGGFSVTGGYVYRGPVKEFQGQYFFSDFETSHFWTLDPDSNKVLNRTADFPTEEPIRNVSSFGDDGSGDLYVTSHRFGVYRIETSSRDAVWDGQSIVGSPGDGSLWSDANNWSRDGASDVAFEDGDHLILHGELASNDPRKFSALTLGDAGSLTVGARTEIVSGNITVPAGAVGRVAVVDDGSLGGTSEAIRKLGQGILVFDLKDQAGDMLAIHHGTAELNGSTFTRTKISSSAQLDARSVRIIQTAVSYFSRKSMVLI